MTPLRSNRSAVSAVLAVLIALAVLVSPSAADVPQLSPLGEMKGPNDRQFSDDLYAAWDHMGDAFALLGPVTKDNAKDPVPADKVQDVLAELSAALDHLTDAKLDFLEPDDPPLLAVECIENARLSDRLYDCLEANVCDAGDIIDTLGARLADPKVRLSKKARLAVVRSGLAFAGRLVREAAANLCGVKNGRNVVRQDNYLQGIRLALPNGEKLGYTLNTTFSGRPKMGWKNADFLKARLKLGRYREVRPIQVFAKTPKNDYLAFQAKGGKKAFVDDPGFGFVTTALHLSGDVDMRVDAGRLSGKKAVVAASGDGEYACVELSTVGSAPTEQFAAFCGRVLDGGGFQAYVGLPGGQTQGNVTLPGVTVATLIIEKRGNQLVYSVRDANPASPPTHVATVTSPPEPLAFSLGAADLGPKDEVGFDDLHVEIPFAE